MTASIYNVTDIEEAAGASIALSADKVSVLMGPMRSPNQGVHSSTNFLEGVMFE